MKRIFSLLLIAFSIGLTPAQAQLEPFTDYEISDAVWEIGTIKVKTNAGDHYLEGLKATWVRGAEISKELGYIEDYSIYSSITPESGDFNLLLVTKYASLADMTPSKEKYEAIMDALGQEQADADSKRALETYPELREITGSYIVHEIDLK
ncbi:hypothetical protein [Hyphomonas sp. UBA4494]|jgi:hypothetical protein|uniref:hypothetical protein n=1 Tax=Hyphomonas sp. UBA4494 TaxID=1946631 RepID=UPI0025B98F56|nr:hypothetical protein [Hyphomonas sp. UBA4494]